jgi:hypothetical protein
MRRYGLLAAAILLMFGLASCANDISRFGSRKTAVDPDTYVAAFSINTLVQGGTVPRKGEPQFTIDQLNLAGGQPIQMFGAEAGIGLVLIELPAASMHFEALGLTWRLLDKPRGHYVTTKRGPTVELEAGVVNYLGSLFIADFEMKGTGETDLHPVSIDLVFADTWDQDANRWAERYAVFGNQAPVKKIPGAWNASGAVALERVRVGMGGGIVPSPKFKIYTRALEDRAASDEQD